MHAYIRHVAERFDLRRDIELETRIEAARFDPDDDLWTVTTTGAVAGTVNARWLILGVGCLSSEHVPPFPGRDDFRGEVHHTVRWPADGVDVTGKRVGVVGTGSSAIQSIPLLAEEAAELFVFQRTPNYVVPAQNRPITDDEMAAVRADYSGLRDRARERPTGYLFPFNPTSVLDATDEERFAQLETYWEIGGLQFLGAFGDILTNAEANRLVTEYWQRKVRDIVDDPTTAELLIPDGDVFGGKRLCAGTNYYETYNRENVTLVDVSSTPITGFTERGLRRDDEIELDVVVLATGFHAMTGSVVRMDIAGPTGLTMAEKWSDGPHNYLGLMINGFPNLFNLQGPGSPSVFVTMVAGIEHQMDWIVECLSTMRDAGRTSIEPTAVAEQQWVAEVARVAEPTLRSKVDSWYTGANIPGKARIFMPWIGGFPAYREHCQAVIDDGWRGFEFG